MSEQDEVARAQTSVNIRFEIIGCEIATMKMREGTVIPQFDFSFPCPFNKVQTDQECRMCRHHKISVLGNDNPTAYRYFGYGAIFPVHGDDVAEKLLNVLYENDGRPLVRPKE